MMMMLRGKLIYRHLACSDLCAQKSALLQLLLVKIWMKKETNDVIESWIFKKNSFIYLIINPVELQYDLLQATII